MVELSDQGNTTRWFVHTNYLPVKLYVAEGGHCAPARDDVWLQGGPHPRPGIADILTIPRCTLGAVCASPVTARVVVNCKLIHACVLLSILRLVLAHTS